MPADFISRTSGLPLVIVALCFIAYALFGANLPGPLAHTEISYEALIEQLFLLTEGIYGVAITAAATMIFAFVLFGPFFRSFHYEQFIYRPFLFAHKKNKRRTC